MNLRSEEVFSLPSCHPAVIAGGQDLCNISEGCSSHPCPKKLWGSVGRRKVQRFWGEAGTGAASLDGTEHPWLSGVGQRTRQTAALLRQLVYVTVFSVWNSSSGQCICYANGQEVHPSLTFQNAFMLREQGIKNQQWESLALQVELHISTKAEAFLSWHTKLLVLQKWMEKSPEFLLYFFIFGYFFLPRSLESLESKY